MNFLAHIYLSGENRELMVGNFIGDFVKGKNYLNYEGDFQKGIILHRQIDSYTDSHPLFKEACQVIRTEAKRYAPVAMDVFFDHFLAKNWSNYHSDTLLKFSHSVFDNFQFYQNQMPERVQAFLPFMIQDNWLIRYAEFDGIDRSLKGINRRTGGKAGLDNGVLWLDKYYSELEELFFNFFKELESFVISFLNEEKK
ncbi:acyl carrier protein phosphodiesterase [Sediminitomix flava]|uniref:Acyl carrier protein phosphodiesterase n=1 Tax=Sediminitomix flava TaxID=379075 RepID=A0A315ZY78_SEDFL|nr:ACP phosphodiesterase [Sediminitomix flava]PWJ42307.1 acyl carrier protein phosphodiesterase [Sediminitomix flava]